MVGIIQRNKALGMFGDDEYLRRYDLEGTGIGVSVVLPGAVASDFYLTSAEHRGGLGGPNLYPTTPPDTAAGMTPAEVAARIVDGIRANRFFIATHAGTRPMVESRQVPSTG